MTPWLSVIIPVHNGAPLLGPALASIAAEDGDGVEVLIYNSADDDGAAKAIADSYCDRLTIRWQDRPDLSNWTYKANVGAREAAGEWLTVLCHDDFWLPGHLAALRRSIACHPGAVMSVAPSRFAGPDGHLLGPWRLPFAAGLYSGQAFGAALLVQNTVAINGAIFRREAFVACGGLDEALWYTADWDLFLKLARTGDVAVRADPTTAYRVHGNAQTISASRDVGEFRRQLDLVFERHLAAFAPSADPLERRARASIDVNCALALAASGQLGGLPGALLGLFRLGPLQLGRLLRETRLIDRLRPRLRLALAGGL